MEFTYRLFKLDRGPYAGIYIPVSDVIALLIKLRQHGLAERMLDASREV